MIDDAEHEKLDALTARIRQAEAKPEGAVPKDAKASGASGAGFEFMGSILGGTLIGWLIDRALGTSPWIMIVMIFLGFAAGMLRVWKAMDGQK